MLVNCPIQMFGQFSFTSCNRISRNVFTSIRQNQQQLRSKCHQQQLQRNQHYRPPQQQQQQKTQLKQQLQQQNERKQMSFAMSAMKSKLNANSLKGSVCLVLLPFSTVSCTSTLNVSTTTQKNSYSSSASASKSNNPDKPAEPTDDMSSEQFKNANSIYDFTVKDTHGNDVSLEKYKGHVVLIVNIASKCGLTKNNYKQLTDLKVKYHDQGLRILNFPCNQFGSQMPEADGEPMVCHLRDAKADIGELFQKVDVNGADTAPLYQYLKAKQSGTLGSGIKWNFTKFLVNKEGIPVNRYAPTTEPNSIAKDIEKLL